MTTGLLTTILGRSAIIDDLGGGANLVLTHVAWGDSHGIPYTPSEAQITLDNERYRSTIASVAVVDGAIVVDAIIPADTDDAFGRPSHGFNVAEVGLFSSDNVLVGVARCGNGYKPPPSSGQVHDVTYRLELAVANPSAITVVIDPQAQINVGRHIRPYWLTVDGVRDEPPVLPPAIGDTYIIGPAPTGAWAGFAHRIAQWVGVWALAIAPKGQQALDASSPSIAGDRWLERTDDGWAPGLTRLIQRQRWNYVEATGDPNELHVTLDPAPANGIASLEAVTIRVKIAYTNTAFTRIFVNGIGCDMRHENGSIIQPGDLVEGAVETMTYMGGAWQVRDRYIISSPITVTVHGPGADFPDLNAAFLWLSARRITKSGSVTFQLAAGTGASIAKVYNGAGNTILFDHPDASRVIIKGAALAGAYPTVADLTVTGYSSGARAADATANLALLRARFGTEIRLTGGATADFRGGAQVKDLLIVGDGSANDGVYFRFGDFSASKLWVHGFGARGIVAAAGYVGTDNLAVTGCGGTGMSAEATGAFQLEGGALVACGNGGAGMRALSACSIKCLSGGLVHARGNAAAGVLGDEESGVQVNAGSTANTNGSSGFVALENSTMKAAGCTATGNANYGAYTVGSCRGVFDGSNFGGNVVGGVYAGKGSTNDCVGVTGTLSPAANVVGNSNSINIQ